MTRSRIFLFAVLSMSLNARAAEPPAPDLPQPLSETIAALDSAVFDAFNRCAAPRGVGGVPEAAGGFAGGRMHHPKPVANPHAAAGTVGQPHGGASPGLYTAVIR